MTAAASELNRNARCTVCKSPNLRAINRALAEPDANAAALGRQYGLNGKAVWTHSKKHMPPSHKTEQVRALIVAGVEKSETLGDQVEALCVKMNTLLDKATLKGKTADAIRASREVRGCLELAARLTNQLQQANIVNVFHAPVWLTVQGNVIAALEPYPEARGAVLRALEGLPS